MLPSAVPATGGVAVESTSIAVSRDDPSGNEGESRSDGNVPAAISPVLPDIPGNIFDDDRGAIKVWIPLTNPATSAINLLGKLDTWGIGPGTPLTDVSIHIAVLTGAQLQNLLKKLPDGMTFALDLKKEED